MSDQNPYVEDQSFIKNSVAAAIQIGLLFLMAAWCIKIISPFIGVVAWAAIIAVAVFPLHSMLARKLGGKEKLSVVIIVVIGLSILLLPTWQLTGSSIETAQEQAVSREEGTQVIPPPADQVADAVTQALEYGCGSSVKGFMGSGARLQQTWKPCCRSIPVR